MTRKTIQTRRSISVKGTTYAQLRDYCTGAGLSVSDFIEQRVAEYLAGLPVKEKPAPSLSARLRDASEKKYQESVDRVLVRVEQAAPKAGAQGERTPRRRRFGEMPWLPSRRPLKPSLMPTDGADARATVTDGKRRSRAAAARGRGVVRARGLRPGRARRAGAAVTGAGIETRACHKCGRAVAATGRR